MIRGSGNGNGGHDKRDKQLISANTSYMLTKSAFDEELPQNQTLQDVISDEDNTNLPELNISHINDISGPEKLVNLSNLKDSKMVPAPLIGQIRNDTPITLTDHNEVGTFRRSQFTFQEHDLERQDEYQR